MFYTIYIYRGNPVDVDEYFRLTHVPRMEVGKAVDTLLAIAKYNQYNWYIAVEPEFETKQEGGEAR